MINHDDFIFSPTSTERCSFKVRGSRFIGTIAPVASDEGARLLIISIRAEFRDATHHAYTYRLGCGSGVIERSCDDGEPAGTAGAPMLQVLRGRQLSDTLVVGTRYYGGVKLGIGGLTRAYRDCARIVLEQVKLVKQEAVARFRLSLNYAELGAVNRLVEIARGTILSADYARRVTIDLALPLQNVQSMVSGFESAVRGRGSLTRLDG